MQWLDILPIENSIIVEQAERQMRYVWKSMSLCWDGLISISFKISLKVRTKRPTNPSWAHLINLVFSFSLWWTLELTSDVSADSYCQFFKTRKLNDRNRILIKNKYKILRKIRRIVNHYLWIISFEKLFLWIVISWIHNWNNLHLCFNKLKMQIIIVN